jgi:hypothetical protein
MCPAVGSERSVLNASRRNGQPSVVNPVRVTVCAVKERSRMKSERGLSLGTMAMKMKNDI